MTRILSGGVGRTIALGLLFGSLSLGVAACEAGYEQEEVEEEGAINEGGIGEGEEGEESEED